MFKHLLNNIHIPPTDPFREVFQHSLFQRFWETHI